MALLASVSSVPGRPAVGAGAWVDRPDLGPIPLTRAFVAQQFEDFHGRQPTAAESEPLMAAIRDGSKTGERVIVEVARKGPLDELEASVTRTYHAYFLRSPDLAGFRYWTDERAGGLGVLSMSRLFAASPEFEDRYGALDDRAFVSLVFQNVLGRAPDAGGLAYWTWQLASGRSRAWVMVQFSESAENRVKTAPRCDIVLLYEGMLRRMPSSAEVDEALALAPFSAVELAGALLRGEGYLLLHPEPVATSYQINAAHDGTEAAPGLPGNLTRRWKRDFAQPVGYPVIAGGRVFVPVQGVMGGSEGAWLYALDVDSGEVLWSQVEAPASTELLQLAYGEGLVYAMNYFGGVVRAYDEKTGEEVWSAVLPNEYVVGAPPVYFGGHLYVVGEGSNGAYSIDAATGALEWVVPLQGATGGLAVDATAVISAGQCGLAVRFDPAAGAVVWKAPASCSGMDAPAVLHGGRAYVRDRQHEDSGVVRQATTGAVVGPLVTTQSPTFAGSVRVELRGTTLVAVDDLSGDLLWSRAGDGTLASSPVVGGGRVYVAGTSGRLYSWDATTGGGQVWLDLGTTPTYPLFTYLAIGDGLLVAGSARSVVAFG